MPLTGCGVPAAAVGVAGLSPPLPSCWNNSGPECLPSVSRWRGGSRRVSWVSSFLGWGKPWSRPRGADHTRRSSCGRGDRLPVRSSSGRPPGMLQPQGPVSSGAQGTTRRMLTAPGRCTSTLLLSSSTSAHGAPAKEVHDGQQDNRTEQGDQERGQAQAVLVDGANA